MTNTRTKNPTAVTLRASPKLRPRSNREGSKGFPAILSHIVHDRQMMYEMVSVPVPSEVMELKAAVEPMLTRLMQAANVNETRMAFTGTSMPGRTLGRIG